MAYEYKKPTAFTDPVPGWNSEGQAYDGDPDDELTAADSDAGAADLDPWITFHTWGTKGQTYIATKIFVNWKTNGTFSDDQFSILASKDGGSTWPVTILALGLHNDTAIVESSADLDANQDLTQVQVKLVYNREKGGDTGVTYIYDIWTRGEYTGGATYYETASDGLKVGETLATQVAFQLSATDGLKGGESTEQPLTIPKSVTDGMKMGDSALINFLLGLLASDGFKLGDQPADWLPDYQYRRKITIKGSSDGVQTNYQMRLAVHKGHAPFAVNGTSHPYSGGCLPAAYYYNGRTYHVWQGANLDPYIDYYQHSTGLWHGQEKVGTNPLSGDGHGVPAVIVDNSGYIHVFFGCHNTAVEHAKSTNTEDITAWTAQTDIGTDCSHPRVVKDSSGDLWLFLREDTGTKLELCYRKSTDWTTRYIIVEAEAAGDYIYSGLPAYDSTNGRIHIAWTMYDSSYGDNVNYYHAYLKLSDGKMYSMSGTDLGTTITFAEAEANCKIVSETTYATLDYPHTRLDGDNYPHVVYWKSEATGGRHGYHIRWSGSSWESANEIRDNLGAGTIDIYINSTSDIDAYVSRPNENFEKWNWNGSSWSLEEVIIDGTDVLAGKDLFNIYVIGDGESSLRVVIGETDYDDYTNFDLDAYAFNSANKAVHPHNRIGLEGNCQTDLDDVRFTLSDGITEINYWRDDDGYVSDDIAFFWVEFDSIPASPSTATFYIYYGNVSAVDDSDGVATFIKFNDYEHITEWDDDLVDIGTPVKTRDTVVYKWGIASLKLVDDDNAAVEGVYIAATSGNKRRVIFYGRANQTNLDAEYHLSESGAGAMVCRVKFDDSAQIQYQNNTGWTNIQAYIADTWYKFEIHAHTADAQWDLYINDILIAADITTTLGNTNAINRLTTRANIAADQPTWWLDNLIVANYTPNEPSWQTWGAEEVLAAAQEYYLTATDGLKLGETTLGSLLLSLILTDGFKGGESTEQPLTIPKSLTDGIKLGDSPLAGLLYNIPASDGMKLGESTLTGLLFNLLAADGSKVSEAIAHEYIAKPSITDGMKLGEGGEIDIGSPAINRPSAQVPDQTYIELANPANKGGYLHEVKVWANQPISDLTVGTFYLVSGTTYKCRDSEYIGNVSAGSEQTFSNLSIEVKVGDYIGFHYTTSGSIEAMDTGGSGFRYVSGEHIDPDDEADFTGFDVDGINSINGSGDGRPITQVATYPSLTDGAKLGDSPMAGLLYNILASDGFKMGETTSWYLLLLLALTDGTKLGETIATLLYSYPTLLDGLKVGDTPLVNLVYSILASDGFKLGDSTLFTLLLSLALTDGIKFGEQVTALIVQLILARMLLRARSGARMVVRAESESKMDIEAMSEARMDIKLEGGGDV